MKKFKVTALLLALMIVSAGCGTQSSSNIKEINMDDLSGVRVGVNLAWDADYLLTERGDAELYRYDMTADELMALNYSKVDAISLDLLTYRIVESVTDGLELVEPPAGYSEYTVCFGHDDGDILESFNAFIEEFEKTDEYADLMERVDAFDGTNYEGPDIELTGTGRVVRFAATDDSYPRSFYGPGSDDPSGFDIELVKRWANANGVKVEWHRSTYDDAVAGLVNGKYDAATGYMSELYREEAEMAGVLVSTGFCNTPIYLIRKSADADKIAIKGDVD